MSRRNKQKTIPVELKIHRDSKGGHLHLIVYSFDNMHASVGTTTTQTRKTNDLSKNPSNKKSKQVYIQKKAIVDKKNHYYGQNYGVMNKADYVRAKQLGKKAKNNYLKNKNSNRP